MGQDSTPTGTLRGDGIPSGAQRVYHNILETIGATPMVRLSRIGQGLRCPIYAKLEYFNPGGSVKDRIARNIITEAEESGRLKPGGTVVEATSGNTGVGLAMVCALKGYNAVFVMPDKMSQEKIHLLRAFGSRVIITPTAVAPEDPRSYYNVARRFVEETPNAILANQYFNPENPRSHYQTTGPEIWEQTDGKVTDVVIGMGTGGTITGVGRYLKEQNPDIRMIGVDPAGSILLETWKAGDVPPDAEAITYKVEGIGEDFLPGTLDLSVVDDVIQIGDRESFFWTRRLVREEGIFAGGSSGTAVAAAMRYSQDLDEDRLVVVLLPDSGSRYLSKIFDDAWMREHGFLEPTWSQVTLGEMLARMPSQSLIVAQIDDKITDVIRRMKENDISQLPALDEDGQIVGLVTEVDLLQYFVEKGDELSREATIGQIVKPAESVYPATTPLMQALSDVLEGNVVLVTRGGNPAGILTKIDVLDFLAHEV